MNPQSNSTGKVLSQDYSTYRVENTNAGSLIKECSEYDEDRDQKFEIYDNNFGNANASNIRPKRLESQRKECEREQRGLSSMEVEESSESTGPQFKNTLELFAAIENMRELLDLSKGEVEYCLQQGTLKTLSVSGQKEQNERQHALERELERLQESEADMRKTNDRLRKENASLAEQTKQDKINLETLRRCCDEEQAKSIKQMDLLEQFEKEKAKLSNDNKSLNEKLLSKQTQYDMLLDEKRKMSTELTDCKTRLSRLMGNKLSDNNPDIADLSDKNRPTKLAEKYQEIYDNEWTVAFEKLEEEFHDEKKSISTLKGLLEDIKRHCDKMAQDQNTAMLESVAMKRLTNEDLPGEVTKQLKDIRKTTAEISVNTVYEQYLNTFKQSHGANRFWLVSDSSLLPFVKACLELCWLMSVQDPPLAFSPDPKHMEIFDSSKYKFYTRTGSSIDFIVWPLLLLHSQGPILSKGIAQARSSLNQNNEEHNTSPTEAQRGKNKVALNVNMDAQAEPSAQVIARSSNEAAKGIPIPNIREDSGYVEISRHFKQGQGENNYKSVVTQAQTTETVPPSTINKNAGLVQGFDAAASFHNKYPREGEEERFMTIGKTYGFNSPEIKQAFGKRYDIIYDYCKTHKNI